MSNNHVQIVDIINSSTNIKYVMNVTLQVVNKSTYNELVMVGSENASGLRDWIYFAGLFQVELDELHHICISADGQCGYWRSFSAKGRRHDRNRVNESLQWKLIHLCESMRYCRQNVLPHIVDLLNCTIIGSTYAYILRHFCPPVYQSFTKICQLSITISYIEIEV